MSVVDQRLSDVGFVDDREQFEDLLGFFRFERCECALQTRLGVFDFSGSLRVEHLATPVAERGVAFVLPTASRAVDGRDRFGFVFGDVDPMESGELALAVFAEDGDIAGCSIGATDPAVMVFDVCLVQISRRQERGAGFAEICQRDWSGDARVRGRVFEDVVDHSVANALSAVELRPERNTAVRPVRMVFEPSVDERHRGDKQDGSLTLFSIHSDLETVFVVLDVTDTEALELSTAEASVELQGNHRLVARVVRGLDHRLDVGLPAQHVAGVRRRVVIAGRAGRHPIDGLGAVITVGDSLGEDAECAAVVSVGLLVGIGGVDPGHERFTSITRFERARKEARLGLLGNNCDVAQQFEMSIGAVFLCEEGEPVVELLEEVSVGGGDIVVDFNALLKIVELIGRILAHTSSDSTSVFINLALNRGFTAGPWLRILSSKPSRADAGDTAEITAGSAVNQRFKATAGGAA